MDEAVYNPSPIEEITNAADDSTWIEINDRHSLLVYTDGSALRMEDRTTARAGPTPVSTAKGG